MKTMNWVKKYDEWIGTAAELATVAQEVIEIVGMKEPAIHPNERLIRHYVQMGVLDRPERKGREAHFGFRQLAQYLVARNLALDGWPLAKIAEFTTKSDLPGLLTLIPKPIRSQKVLVAKKFAQIGQAANRPTKAIGRLQKKQITEIILTPWCKVHIDQNALHNLHPENAKFIGMELTQLLLSESK